MQFDRLEHFRVLAHLQHMTHAADQLQMSQPALSRSIARLEEDVGLPLFDRVGRGIVLNPIGREFLAYIERAFRNIEDGRRFIGDMLAFGIGRVRLFDNGYDALGTALVMAHAAADPDDALERLIDRRDKVSGPPLASVDVDLTGTPQSAPDREWLPLCPLELELLVPPGSPVADAEFVRLADVGEARFVGPVRGCESRERFEGLCAAAGFRPRFSYEGVTLHDPAPVMRAQSAVAYRFVPAAVVLPVPAGLRPVPVVSEGERATLGLDVTGQRSAGSSLDRFVALARTTLQPD